jgi:hypothetical protein
MTVGQFYERCFDQQAIYKMNSALYHDILYVIEWKNEHTKD